MTRRLGPKTPPTPTKGVALFPSLLVLPNGEGKSKSARRRARRRGRDDAWEYAEMMWAYFTYLEGGSPYKHSDQHRLMTRALQTPWTSLHASYAGSLHDEINRYVRLRCNTEPLSRGVLKLSELVKVVRNADYSSRSSIDKLARTAKNVKPDRMSLPVAAGIVDPRAYLKGAHLQTFNNLASEVPHNETPPHPTKGCYKVEPQDVHAVNLKLLRSGVATLIPEELAMRDHQGNIITGGLFAVDHKPTSDRIILDRRPFNELERRLVWARLPHGSLLTQLIVPKGHSIRGSGDDLSNYFYLLKHHEEWLPRNAVGNVFDGLGYEEFGGIEGKNFLLSFRVIAMGDLNAVDISQQVHLEILRDCQCMAPHECIEFKRPLPASATMEGLYIDDHIITQILPSRKHRDQGDKFRDEILLERSRAQYASQGIPTSTSKAFSKADSFVAWGTHIDNKSGRVGSPLIKLKQLATLLATVVTLPKVSKKLLQGITGLLIHPFMHRRSLMCLLQETFIWLESLGEDDQKGLPAPVREELLSCGLMLPLCHANLRWPISQRIGASDASLTHGGRAATYVPASVSQTLFRFAEHRGEHVRLDWQRGALQHPSTMQPAPEELESLIQDLPWNQTETCSFGHRQRINILETRMIHRELKDVVHQSTSPMRCVLLVDSRAAAGAWSKGRSSAKNLNRILRQALGWSLVGRKSIHLVWVRSEANPSDYPSRCKRIPEPPDKPSNLTREVLGPQTDDYRRRRSNREIWRAVEREVRNSSGLQQHTSRCPASESCAKTDAAGSSVSRHHHPAAKSWTFREIFAGSGHLSKAFINSGLFSVGKPVEIMQRGKYDSMHDILNDDVFNQLCIDAASPRQLWHFGFPCGSFSIMQNMNKGTRTGAQPLGDGTLKREVLGNKILERTTRLCMILHQHNSFFTLENPLTSFAWKTFYIRNLVKATGCTEAVLDQCMYGLSIPNQQGLAGLAKKPTKFLGTMPMLDLLSTRCNRFHPHVAVLGTVKVAGKWRKRSQLAGSYPSKLCTEYIRTFSKSFSL